MLSAATAFAKDWRKPQNRRGFEMWAGIGINACVEDGDADCENTDASIAGSLSIGGRFIPYLGAYLDISGGLLDQSSGVEGDADLTTSTLTVMPVLRGFIPVSLIDIYFGVGAGYTQMKFSVEAEGEEGSATVSSWLQGKLQTGVAINVASNVAVGVNLDLIIQGDDNWEVCAEYKGDEDCEDVPDGAGDVAEIFQGTAYVRMNF